MDDRVIFEIGEILNLVAGFMAPFVEIDRAIGLHRNGTVHTTVIESCKEDPDPAGKGYYAEVSSKRPLFVVRSGESLHVRFGY